MVSLRSVAQVHAVIGDEQSAWLNGPDYLRVLYVTIAAVAGAPKSAWHGHLTNALFAPGSRRGSLTFGDGKGQTILRHGP